ncbi:MAG: uroporphyrinogen-III synthase [Gammaproteobacteria bacterium]|nr:uroporphyrinogen-III synthase [Gammaproteobacteria bacterium]
MTTSKPLKGVGVLITRPEHQADDLCQSIESLGGTAIRFPVLQIEDIDDTTLFYSQIDRLDTFDIAIFISPNAVNKAISLVRARKKWPDNVKIAAVGKTSAKALDRLGLIADIFPSKKFNSEALLSLDEMQDVSGKNIIIFRGDGGRELLAETLKSRGATVEYAECYKRSKPKTDVSALLKHWARGEVNIIVTTSNEGLHNLYDMVGQLGRQWLTKSPVIVISDRGADLAMQLGFKHRPIVSSLASDEAIVNTLVQWHALQCA